MFILFGYKAMLTIILYHTSDDFHLDSFYFDYMYVFICSSCRHFLSSTA